VDLRHLLGRDPEKVAADIVVTAARSSGRSGAAIIGWQVNRRSSTPSPLPEPTPASGASPAGQEPRASLARLPRLRNQGDPAREWP